MTENMTEKEYRKHPAISRSELWKISESPQKFKWAKENPESPTPSLLFGQAFHTLALQREIFFDEFAVEPNVDKCTKEGKTIYAEFIEQAQGKTIISADMFEQSKEMCASLDNEPLAVKLLNSEKEKPFFWIDELTGEECKCRTDVLNLNFSQPIIVDIKSTGNASTEAFIKSAIKYGYDFQAAMYVEGVQKNIGKKPLFVFIAVEKKPPYAVNILQADELLLKRGFDLFRELIGTYHWCKENNNWYGYMGRLNQINNLALPAWLAKEID